MTFVFRGDENTRSVGLLAPLGNVPRLPNLPLKKLAGTNVWYVSWRMRDDLRFSYRFAVNVKPGEDPLQIATVDPLNPHGMEVCFEGNTIPPAAFSIASGPGAGEERWISKRPVPAGKVDLYSVPSAVLGAERRIWVYTPPGYHPNAPAAYTLLILFDGFNYRHWIPAPTLLDNLIHARKIPPLVAVFVDDPPGSRFSDLHYNDKFVQFTATELLPWIQKRWNVTRDPHKTIVGGYSMGGSAAAFAAMRRPDVFGKVLSQSGAFWEGEGNTKWEFLASQFESSPKLPLRFFLEAGVLEDTSEDGPTLLAANRHLVRILKTKGYTVTYEEMGGTHEPVHWRDTFPEALISLLK